MKRKRTTLFLVLTAAFTALTAIATAVIAIPGFSGMGYLNLGDAVIFIASFLLGPIGGAVVGGVGSAIADLFVAPVYAPFTLVVKGLEGFLCGILYVRAFKSVKWEILSRLLSMLVAGLWMIFGYILADWIILMATGSAPMVALTTAFVGNIALGALQVGLTVVIALLVSPRRLKGIMDSGEEQEDDIRQ